MSKGLEALYGDHENMRLLLRLLEAEMEHYRAGGIPDFELLHSIMDYTLLIPNLIHHPKEDLVFQHLIQRHPASAEAILDLLTEHARLGVLTRRIAAALRNVAADVELPRAWLEDLLSEYVTAMRSHMEIEEREFFPRAADHLTDLDWAQIDAATATLKDPVFGGTAEESYGRLSSRIAEVSAQEAGAKVNKTAA